MGHDMDDEVPLPIVEVNGSLPSREQRQLPNSLPGRARVLPLEARRSILYRATLPAQAFWTVPSAHSASVALAVEDTPPGRLEIWLPDGRPLLQHVFEPVRWLPAKRSGRPLEGAECEAAGGALDSVQGWCSERHGVARICYALPP